MKRTIYDCWKCRHSNSDNPYGIDYCEVHDTRCSFAYDDCDNFEPTDGDNADTSDITHQALRTATVKTVIILAVIITCVLLAIFSSCTTTEYVPVVELKTDTLLCYSSMRDSIYVHDSIHVMERGDTVTIERWHTRWRDRWHSDTVFRSRTDSVPYPVEVVKEVPRERGTVEWALLIIGLLAIAWIIFRITTKIKHV